MKACKQNFNIKLMFSILLMALVSCQSRTQESPTRKETNSVTGMQSSEKDNVHNISDRFESEIRTFEEADRIQDIQGEGIVFTGSSSIRLWSTLSDDMGDLPVLNRGFGGATIPEALYFAERYLFRHQPQIIVFYCGENDISEGASPETVYTNFKAFVDLVNHHSSSTQIIYISMKPSPSRWHLWKKYQEGDKLIKKYIEQDDKLSFINSSLSMLESDGTPKKDIFIEDGLHMNASGYVGWTAQLLPMLKDMYKENDKM